MKILVYRCPGAYKSNHDVMYDFKQADSEDIPEGWYESLEEAAKACGPKCLYVKREKPPLGVNKHKRGLPVTYPSQVEAKIEEYEPKEESTKDELVEEVKTEPVQEQEIEDKVDKSKKAKLTPEDKEEIITLLSAGKSQTEVAERYGVSRQLISQIKKKHGVY